MFFVVFSLEIRWLKVFFLRHKDPDPRKSDPVKKNRIRKTDYKICCVISLKAAKIPIPIPCTHRSSPEPGKPA